MSKNVQSVTLSSAFAGLLAGAVACGGKTEKPVETPAVEAAPAPVEAAPAKVEASAAEAVPVDAAAGEQPAAMPAHECKGKNEFKGQGGCVVAGQNDCKGQNECKGKGGCKTA